MPLPRIWVLLGDKRGDNNQALALAEALELPFETLSLDYLPEGTSERSYGEVGVDGLTDESREQIRPPWPDLVIGIGWRSVPMALHVKQESGGRAKLVRLGNPRCDPGLFDLVFTTRQYPVAEHPNVRLLPVAMSRFGQAPEATADERAFLDGLARPHMLMVVGGNTKYWRLPLLATVAAALRIARRARRRRGRLIISPSPRTPERVGQAMALLARLHPGIHLAPAELRFAVLLADADEIFVTADSVAMLSEAIATGKPVGMIPIRITRRGIRKIGRTAGSKTASSRRDLRRFWSHLLENGLIGTIDRPRAAAIDNPAEEAAAAVRALLVGVDSPGKTL